MDWIIFWTIFGPVFLDQFFWTILKGGHTISTEGGWDEVYQYWGRGGRQSVITQGGARDGLLLRREGWEVVVIVNTTGLIGFSTEFLCV